MNTDSYIITYIFLHNIHSVVLFSQKGSQDV